MTSADLITELQATRPTADGVLRDRVRLLAASEPKPRRSLFERLSLRRLSLVAVPATAVVLFGAAAITGLLESGPRPQAVASGGENPYQVQPPSAEAARIATPQLKAGTALGSVSANQGAAADATGPLPTVGRAQRYSAALTLSVKDNDALSGATQQVLRITRDLGGYVVTTSFSTSDNGAISPDGITANAGISTLTVKVPTAKVQDAIVRFSDLGKIVGQQVQIDDLQGQVDELAKSENVLRERIARLSARLAATDLDAETRATLQARRDAARSELAQVRTARTQVDAEARYATIQLSLQTRESSVVPSVPTRWDRGLDRAVEILVLEAMVVLYALVIVGPLAVLALLAWLGHRGLRRKQDEQLLSTP